MPAVGGCGMGGAMFLYLHVHAYLPVRRLIAGYHSARMFHTLKGSSWRNAAALVSGWVRDEVYLLVNVAASAKNTITVCKNVVTLHQYSPKNF